MLPTLLRRAVDNVPDLDRQEIKGAAINPNAHYIPSRYPAEVGGPDGPITAEDAAEALSWAETIAAVVRPLLTTDETR